MTPIRSYISPLSTTLFLFVAILSAGSPAAGESDRSAKHDSSKESTVLKRILANWTARQERVKSFHFVWDRRITVPKEYFAEHRSENGRSEFHDEQFAVRDDELWVDGNDRIRRDSVKFVPGGPSTVEQSARDCQVVLGNSEKHLFTTDDPNALRIGDILSGRELNRLVMFGYANPPMAAYRPFHVRRIIDPQTWRVVTFDAIIGNVHCVKIERRGSEAEFLETCWVDPKREDVIVERESVLRQDTATTTTEFKADQRAGWVPIRWTSRSYDRDSVLQMLNESTVVKYAINEPISQSTFDLKFPPRTLVLDDVHNERYLIRNDGTKRLLSKDEVERHRQGKLDYKDLLKPTDSRSKR
ncbi:MAG TPA: hypothetical protein VHX68_11975 [Planctomycetaceae bacterium]|nr:hypothetical protein [Planctomycetaceae bacterium]